MSEFTSVNVEGSAGTALWKPAGALHLVEEVLDLFASAWVTKLSECLCFDLTYSFTGNVKALTDLFKSTRLSVLKTESELEYLCFTLLIELFFEEGM